MLFSFLLLNQKITNQVIWGEKQFFSNESLDIFLNQTAEISAIIFKKIINNQLACKSKDF